MNGNKYVGEFRDGKMDGVGTYTYASGDKYFGEFKNGNMDGRGRAILGGRTYEGIFRKGTFLHAKKVFN